MHTRMGMGVETRWRVGFAARAAVAVLLLAGAGPAAAQTIHYADLDAAVPSLASKLVENDRLAGKRVLVNAHDFFEEGTGRNLPLSETLRQRFRTELSVRGVQVFALPEGSEDDMVIVQGVWRALPGPGVRQGSRKIDLAVNLIERTGDGQRVLPTGRGRVDAVDEALLTPDLESWGRHVVRELERRAGGHGRRVIHVRKVGLDGEDAPKPLEKYLVRRWLSPAFSRSRLFTLATADGGGREGALDVDVFVHGGDVEIVLTVEDRGIQVASFAVEMAKELIPPGYIEPSPNPVAQLLQECEGHERGKRWAEAWGCHGEVLKLDAGNEAAQRGLDEIERGYGERMRAALGRSDFAGAKAAVEGYARLAPESPRVQEWEGEIEGTKGEIEGTKGEIEGTKFRDCEECPLMVVVPSGTFRMGSPAGEAGRNEDEGPVHEVTIGERLAVGVYEVTVGEFGRFVGETGYSTGDECWTFEGGEWEFRSGRGWRGPGFAQTEGHPVVCVSWDDARAYVGWLSRETGAGYRLMSESEWEYAARAGTRRSRYWGEGESGQCGNENGADEALMRHYPDWKWAIASCDDGRVHTAEAGSYGSNGNGLHDMLGNVWEWVEDCWHGDYEGAPGDGSAWVWGGECESRMLRGGSWDNGPWDLRSANRGRNDAGNRFFDVGFRVARTLTP